MVWQCVLVWGTALYALVCVGRVAALKTQPGPERRAHRFFPSGALAASGQSPEGGSLGGKAT